MTTTSTLVVDFRPNLSRTTLEAVQSTEDEQYNRPVVYYGLNLQFSAIGFEPGLYEQTGSLVHYGVARIRLYMPASMNPTFTSLEPMVPLTERPEVLQPPVGIFFPGVITYRASGYVSDEVVKIGRFTDNRVELLSFDLSTEEQIKYPYDNSEVTIDFTTDFVDEDGNAADTPRQTVDGRFVSPIPVIGGIAVRYSVGYTAYDVFYDHPNPVRRWEILPVDFYGGVLYKKSTPYIDHLDSPPDLTVITQSGSSVTQIDIRREFGIPEVEFKDSDDDDTEAELVETSRTEEEERFQSETDPTQFIDVSKFVTVAFQDPMTGKKTYLKLTGG